MKTSLVIASVLLAGVALEVAAAFRIDNDYGSRHGIDKQWTRLQQKSPSSDDGYYALDAAVAFTQTAIDGDYQKNIGPFDKYMSGDADFDFADRSRQYYYGGSFESADADSAEDDYRGDGLQQQQQQHVSVDGSAGLAKKMVQKIAAIQQIAVEHDADAGLYRQMNLNSNAIKLPSGQNFVTFYNATMKYLDDGDLKYLYINPDKDAVLVQYKFDRIETVGSFKSNVHNAKSGYFTILLNDVYSNVSAGFNSQHAAVRPANFASADAIVKTDAGAETQAFDDALEHKYLTELGHAVSVQVLKATDMGMIGQMKAEARKPMYAYYGAGAGGNKGKLFDMGWTEDGVTMEMSGIGYGRLPEQAGQQLRFGSVAIQRKSDTVYKTLYEFALYGLKWTSALAVQTTGGQRMIARSVDVDVPKAYVQVAITKSLNRGGQQQLCGDIDADVTIKGFQYKINDDLPSELRSKIEQKFKRFFEHNLEAYVEESLKQEICYNGKY